MKPTPLAMMISALVALQAQADTNEANNTDALYEVDKVVVNATRMSQDASEVSRQVTVIEQDEIETFAPQSTAEILANQPNILIQGGSRPGYQSVNIRGMGDNRVLQTVDGVRQDFQSGHRPSYFLDPLLLKSVEVVKGPASTLWGSGALGGVVAQTTVDASDVLEADQTVGGKVKTGFNFNNDQSASTAILAGRGEQIDWLISGYYRDSNNITLGDGSTLENSASQDQGFLGKAEWQLDESQSVALNVRHGSVEGYVPSNGSSNVNGSSVFQIEKDQVNSSAAADYRIDSESDLVDAQVMVSWNRVDIDETRVSDGRADTTQKDSYSLNVNNLSRFDAFDLFYGIDGTYSEFSATRGGTNRPTPPDADIQVWGAFGQSIVPINDSLNLEMGARFDYFGTTANNLDSSRSDNALSPSLALVWQANDDLELILRHDVAFRAPTAEELYSTGTHFCMGVGMCNTFVSDPNLKAETSHNTEFISNYQVNDQWSVNFAAFENHVDDFIEQTVTTSPFPGTTYWSNVDKATLRGFELSTAFSHQDTQLKLAYGQTRGSDDTTGDALNNIPADTWTADLNTRFAEQGVTAGLRLTHAEEQNRSTDETYDDYTTADIYASWQPQAVKNLTLNASINNLSDEYYRRAWSQLYEAGREITLSATYQF